MERKCDDYEDEFEMRRSEPSEEEEHPFLDEPRPSRRRRIADAETKKAPLVFRIAAWAGVIAFCFVAGYVGTSLALRMLNRKDILVRQDVVTDREQAQGLLDNGNGEIHLNARKVAFSIYYPKNGVIVSEKVEFLSGIMEDDIQQVFERTFTLLSEKFAADVKLLDSFRTGDTLFLNFSSSFLASLANSGEKESTLFITAVLQTMKKNFSPITKVRFLVNGEVPKEGSPVDLTVPWQLPQG